ncbi:MAK10-like protein, partial [Tanacetum coccineum]
EDLTTHFLFQFFPSGRAAKLHIDILMFQQHQGESLSEAWTRFKDLLKKVPHHGIDIWLQVKIFYDHVNPTTRRTIDQSASDVSSTSDRRLIKLENQVQRLMEAHLAPKQPIQVNKITFSCGIYTGPHDTQYYMKNTEQAFIDYASSCTVEAGGKQFAMNQGARSFNEAANAWKGKTNFNWAHSQTFTSPRNVLFSTYSSSYQMKPENVLIDFDSHQETRLSSLGTQLGQQQDDTISKINLLWKAVFEKLDDTPTQQNRNPSIPKCVHFYNSIIILNKEDEAKEERCIKSSATKCKDHEITVESEEEFKEETKEETKEEEEDNLKYFDIFTTIKELGYHEWLLKNPQPPWVKAKIRIENLNNIKFSCMISHFDKKQAYLDVELPVNVMSRLHYN